ncbi:MAG: peptidoglycan recognition family protein [Solirubrobacterales bacterium]|nr:peptidoglycan recognition family protein [Solirubrobacterales bacterium]
MTATIAALAVMLSSGFAPPAATQSSVAQPPVRHHWINYNAKRRSEMAAYSMRHYGRHSYHLVPRVIVEHWTQTRTAAPVFAMFAADTPDSELHELPGVCSHYLIDTTGTIYQLVPLTVMCRHTVGLNDHAIGIEHVGMSDRGVMTNHRQITASIRLTRWLRCRYRIALQDIIGHSESVSSRFHHERIARLRNQTHSDMQPATMRSYRSVVARQACPLP